MNNMKKFMNKSNRNRDGIIQWCEVKLIEEEREKYEVRSKLVDFLPRHSAVRFANNVSYSS